MNSSMKASEKDESMSSWQKRIKSLHANTLQKMISALSIVHQRSKNTATHASNDALVVVPQSDSDSKPVGPVDHESLNSLSLVGPATIYSSLEAVPGIKTDVRVKKEL